MKKQQTVKPASLDFAKRLFTRGTDALGSAEISRAFRSPSGVNIPDIPFSEEELKRARGLGQYLILQVNTINGKPCTIQSIKEMFNNVLGDGKLLYDTDWYSGESFYTTDTPRFGWALVSRDVILASVALDYLDQTQTIADYLVNEVYKEEELPVEYQAAVTEWNACKKIRNSDWKKCAKGLAGLKLNTLFREKPVEVLYGLVVQHEINHERLLGDQYSWTNQRSSRGHLVSVGYCDSDGVYVSGDGPGVSDSDRGVRFFRSSSDLKS
jgi:hypothetical protein